ncbi:ABC transporter ATP-binding protein [Gracilibacillus sp. S3-1-1]|uniref:ABC transporter ATP-binding protein n=1 Tax=Gracilibacillus pellucidus TaxID=3095368 RepID=A0ACC6M4C5_9BACI|nr:ABC transporter ATP-binding protein [Gracilibacillus sp. S3-1-1]MDX8045831.1 ABC transporter ATP-binding protein [Gracilibacillus sp. S3-1-1]
MALLEVKNLSIYDTQTENSIIEKISFTVERNSSFGIVGESGSGKSMMVKGILGLMAPWMNVSGSVYFTGIDISEMKTKALRQVRANNISLIMQDAMSAFDPLDTIGKQMIETFSENLQVSKKEAKQLATSVLQRVGIKEAIHVLKKYPHQLSGGMLQRCMIAIAVALKPDMIIADEPTTALDAITQSDIIKMFQKLQTELGTTFIFISHDLAMIQQLTQEVMVMKNGKQVESGKTSDVLRRPQHTYTQYLVNTRLTMTKSFEKVLRKDTDHA